MIFDFKEYFPDNIESKIGQYLCETSKINTDNEYICSWSNGEDIEESSDDGSDNFVIQRRMVLNKSGNKEVRTTNLGEVSVKQYSHKNSNSINKQKFEENQTYIINTI